MPSPEILPFKLLVPFTNISPAFTILPPSIMTLFKFRVFPSAISATLFAPVILVLFTLTVVPEFDITNKLCPPALIVE